MSLTEIEYNKIKEDVTDVLAFSQGLFAPLDGIDELLTQWKEAKQRFISIFGDKLIYEFDDPITFEIGDVEKSSKISDFCDRVGSKWGNEDLADFIHFARDDFYSNILSQDYKNEKYLVKKGSKIIKAFKYFESDKETLTTIQNEASMLIQEDKITGKLCISVHPLDYLSSSENNYKWRSCHALDGEYRAGNLSYMVDSSTVICYLKGEEDHERLPNFPRNVLWNSKKWRMLLFINENKELIFAGRQYPFSSSTALDVIKKKVFPLFKTDFGYKIPYSDWTNFCLNQVDVSKDEQRSLSTGYFLIRSRLYDKHKVIKDARGSMHFNDLLNSSYYTPYYSYTGYGLTSLKLEEAPLIIGGKCNCIKCGKEKLFDPQSMLCEQCNFDYGDFDADNIAYCECCGRRIWIDESPYVEDAEGYLCPDCADKRCTICEHCGGLYYNESIQYDKRHHEMRCIGCHSGIDL